MFIPEIEKKSLEEIKIFQEGKLKETLGYLKMHSKYYQRMFESNNINIEQIVSLEDLENIPVTTKDDLQKFNDDFLCVNHNKLDNSRLCDLISRYSCSILGGLPEPSCIRL